MRLVVSSIAFAALGLGLFACCNQDQATIEERNKETIVRIHAEVAKGNIAIMDEVLAPDYLRHCQAMPPELQELSDKTVFKGFLSEWVGNVSNFKDTVTNMVAEGNMVAYVSTMSGVHSGPIGDMPATGKSFTVVNLVIQRFNDEGQVAETWVSWDNLAFLSQVGLFPPPPPEMP